MFDSLLGAFGSVFTFAAVIFVIWLAFKVLSWPIKIFFKLLWNAVIGAVILVLINLIGGLINFTLPITWLSALAVGLFGTVGVVTLVIIKLLTSTN